MNDSLIETSQSDLPQTDTTEATTVDPTPSQDGRPEWLPEKYSSAEELAKAYKNLESKIGQKEEDLRKQITDEISEQAYADRPKTSGDYKLPESVDEAEAVDNELMKWWSEHSFENGYGQEDFEKGIEMYMSAVQGQQPDLTAEAARLGDNASVRVDAASAFASKFFPAEVTPAIERMCETAEGIMAIEIIMENMKDGSFSGDASISGQVNEASLQEMMRDPRYHHVQQRDPNFVKQVEDGFKKLYG